MVSALSTIVFLISHLIVLTLVFVFVWFIGYYFVVRTVASVTYVVLYAVEGYSMFTKRKVTFDIPKEGTKKRIIADFAGASFALSSTLVIYGILQDPESIISNFKTCPMDYMALFSFFLLMIINFSTERTNINWIEKIETTPFISVVFKLFKGLESKK